MGEGQGFSAEFREIEKIDFLLDELARAVERGELHRASYDILAPRYLTRRETLVARITGVPAPASSRVPAPTPRTAPLQPEPSSEWSFEPRVTPSKPVPWTTILLFLGAFLVVVASSIFAIAIWDVLGATEKLVFLGTLTAGFYVAGWWARTRLELRAGGVVLTAVASAMLLLDGWIAIDGYNLEGPLPWAVLFFVCSAAYWFTEVRIAGRFFGVIGAAAQIAWWWLLGEGLGVPAPARFAGVSLIALAWQYASLRARRRPEFETLAVGLAWSAPVVQVIAAVGIVWDLALVGTSGPFEVAYAAIVAVSAALTVFLSAEIGERYKPWAVAVLQFPLFAAVLIATEQPSWWLAGALLGMSTVYAFAAILWGGAPIALIGLVSELMLVFAVCDILDADPTVWVAAAAGLAVTWAGASVLARRLPRGEAGVTGAPGTAIVAEIGAYAVLGASSLAAPFAGAGVVLTGVTVPGGDAALAVGLLAAWAAVSWLVRRPGPLFATALWSIYSAAAVAAWIAPGLDTPYYAALLAVVAGAWIAGAHFLWRGESTVWRDVMAWVARAGVLLITLGGFAADQIIAGVGEDALQPGRASVAVATLFGTAAVIYAVDAAMSACVASAAAGSAFTVFAAYFLASGIAEASGALFDPQATAAVISASVTSAVLVAGSVLLRGRRLGIARALAIAAPVASLVAIASSNAPAGGVAAALALTAAAWCISAFVVTPWLAGVGGLTLVAAVSATLQHLDADPWVTVAALGVTAFALGMASFAPSLGRGGRHWQAGMSLALSGLVANAYLALLGLGGSTAGLDGWAGLSEHAFAVATLLLGAHTLVQAVRWRFEPALYGGWAFVLVASWVEFGALDVDYGEFYTTSLAVYLVAMAYLHLYMGEGRRYPVVLDAASVVVGLGIPLLWSLGSGPGASVTHALWVVGLSLVAIVAGIAAKSRWWFFGGAAALAAVALYRSFFALIEFWWIGLGLIGIAMLIIALTWERQRMLAVDARDRIRQTFDDWR